VHIYVKALTYILQHDGYVTFNPLYCVIVSEIILLIL